MVKKILSRIFPPSAKAFHFSVHKLNQRLDELDALYLEILNRLRQLDEETASKHTHLVGKLIEDRCEIAKLFHNSELKTEMKIDEFNKNIQEYNLQYESHVNESKKALSNIITELKHIKTQVKRNTQSRIFYKNIKTSFDHEVLDGFLEYRKRHDFEEIYLKLVSGLDAESRRVVTQIHTRLELINQDEGEIDLFTEAEQHGLKMQRELLGNNIYRVSDTCYSMGEFILPANVFLPAMFLDKMCMDYIRNLDCIADKSIIDAGAYIGDSLQIFRKWTDETIYCFEPMSSSFMLLEKTISLNNLPNVVVYNAALGAEKGHGSFSFVGRGLGSKEVTIPDESTEAVEIMVIDDFVKEGNIQVGLIKIDVEGAEQRVLEGAKKTIMSQKPTLIISLYHNANDFYNIKPIIESWDLGYKFKIHKALNGSIITDTELIAEVY
ncbi:MAG: FkbM family methyltransferase [Defluviitaleaceae bacterium]|nr:FkbM family methyltransferase [Defluviitaleaceae bacterium]